MWRRLISSDLQTLATRSLRRVSSAPRFHSTTPFKRTSPLLSPAASAASVSESKGIRIEDVMPIATGHEREELEAQLQGRNILDINFPEGPFGTKEAPAIVKSVYDKRIVGCPGVDGEDEHDVVWFWLEKGKPHECPVCSQYFKLEVVGPGGPPDGHGDDHH
ncbi:cytochrome c oxidase subunit 5b-2, mitochondrial-like [Apium graveolens]|uniref:cytochrome c oxidase subunit 5b-2, mitochondrial-like n=1 Tax=Apium graveolens TaxID=4045 RepID=UPI003D78E2DE